MPFAKPSRRAAPAFRDVIQIVAVCPGAVAVVGPSGLMLSLELRDHVVVEREVGPDIIVEMFPDPVPPVQGYLDTLVPDFPKIGRYGAYLSHGQVYCRSVKDVACVLVVQVYLSREAVVEHPEFYSEVGRGGGFPLEIGIAQGGNIQACGQLAVYDGIVDGIECLPGVVADALVVAGLSPGEPHLQHGQPCSGIPEEGFFRGYPSCGERREYNVSAVDSELGGAVGPDIGFENVSVPEGVVDSSEI